jgi:hypothetical protein
MSDALDLKIVVGRGEVVEHQHRAIPSGKEPL